MCLCNFVLFESHEVSFHSEQNQLSAVGTPHESSEQCSVNTVQCLCTEHRNLRVAFLLFFVCLLYSSVQCAENWCESIMNVATIRLNRIHFTHFLLTKLFISFGSWMYTLSLISIRYQLSIFKHQAHWDIETNLTATLIKWLWCHSMSITIWITCHKWFKWFNRFYTII